MMKDNSNSNKPVGVSPYRECPKFFKCSVNNCPLHPGYPNLYVDQEDRETKCKMEKPVRLKIGSQYPTILKWQGLTSREWAGKKNWESLTVEERQKIKEDAKSRLTLACQKQNSSHDCLPIPTENTQVKESV